MLLGDVGCGAVGGDPDRGDAGLCGILEVMDGANSRDQQGGQSGMLEYGSCCFDPFEVGMSPETIVEGRTGQSVAVGDLDRVDLGRVKGADDALDLLERVLMTDG